MIVDDQQLLLDLLEQMLQNTDDIQIVARASDGDRAVDLAKENQPDVVLMDIIMPGCNGIEATKRIKKENEKIKILVLTMSESEEDILEALRSGADGYILKSASKEELLLAIRGVYHNMEIINSGVKKIIHSTREKSTDKTQLKKSVIVNEIEIFLSERKLKIIEMIVDGRNTKEMAEILFISEGRLRNIITGILSKLMLNDRRQLAVFALKKNLLKKPL